MFAPETTETTDFKQCQACGAAQSEGDKFCRRCGASQSRRVESMNCIAGNVAGAVAEMADRTGCETRPLSASGSLRKPYSGPLVNSVTRKLSEQTASLRANRRAMLLISALVAAPLWLMIVLLSPLDAYVAAKDLAKQL
jgi:hypothetical protein